MNKLLRILPAMLIPAFLSCDIKESDISPDASFIRVYESTNVDEAYYPEDIIQLGSGNYLIVASLEDSSLTNYPKISLTALSPAGEVLSSEVLPENYTNPVPGWLRMNGSQYFLCMDDISLRAKLIEVTLNGEELGYSEAAGFDQQLPLYAWSDGSALVILSYDRVGRNSRIYGYDNNLNQTWGSQIAANEDFENAVRLHLTKQGKQFPFFIDAIHSDGNTTGFFVNCLANYSLAMVFLDQGGTVTGRLYTYQEQTGISSGLCLGGDTFAVSRFHSGDNYIYPKVGLDVNALQNAEGFNDIFISQLKADAPMDIMMYEKSGREFIVYASTSKQNEIFLLFFDAETGEQEYTHTLGYGNEVEVVNIIPTLDGGMAVLGKTWIGGQYQRMILYKLTSDELEFAD